MRRSVLRSPISITHGGRALFVKVYKAWHLAPETFAGLVADDEWTGQRMEVYVLCGLTSHYVAGDEPPAWMGRKQRKEWNRRKGSPVPESRHRLLHRGTRFCDDCRRSLERDTAALAEFYQIDPFILYDYCEDNDDERGMALAIALNAVQQPIPVP